jgi:CheY-like chemotaxis protein
MTNIKIEEYDKHEISDFDETQNNIKQEETSKNQTFSAKILIMDDEEEVRDLFSIVLEMLGYETIHAKNNDEAIERYKKLLEHDEHIDAMILDLNIPDSLGGAEVAKIIRELDPNVKLIVCSGDTSCAEMINFKQSGFDGALEKTFNRKVIKELLDKLLK